MKRKIESEVDFKENNLLIKSLRQSVLNFLNENDLNFSILKEKFSFFLNNIN